MRFLFKHKYKILISLVFVLTTVISVKALLPKDETEVDEIIPKDEGKEVTEIDYYDYVDKMHQMANTKIIPVDGKIWGEIEITQSEIDILINHLLHDMKINEHKKNELLKILYRWKSSDFSNCVYEHNYLWKILGGTVGEAIALRDDVIKK